MAECGLVNTESLGIKNLNTERKTQTEKIKGGEKAKKKIERQLINILVMDSKSSEEGQNYRGRKA